MDSADDIKQFIIDADKGNYYLEVIANIIA